MDVSDSWGTAVIVQALWSSATVRMRREQGFPLHRPSVPEGLSRSPLGGIMPMGDQGEISFRAVTSFCGLGRTGGAWMGGLWMRPWSAGFRPSMKTAALYFEELWFTKKTGIRRRWEFTFRVRPRICSNLVTDP